MKSIFTMGKYQPAISRKSFLQLAGVTGLAGILPGHLFSSLKHLHPWPVLSLQLLPTRMQQILSLVPALSVDASGYLGLRSGQESPAQPIPIAPTQWNLEHSHPWDRLETGFPWAIVLHWYGDKPGFDKSVQGYLRGFDEIRKVADYFTRTSAHFLVGASLPGSFDGSQQPIAIIQTQAPYIDGTPLVASHLQALDYDIHLNRKQYFVRALYELGYRQEGIHSILQDWFDGRRVDANIRSLAIEITGCNFDAPGGAPTDQQVANVIGVVWALMQRYGIFASDILGHHEISLGKSDPGKCFMATVRCLLGALALAVNDPGMESLVFGQYLLLGMDPLSAVQVYFSWVRNYLALVSRPEQLAGWEVDSGYNQLNQLLFENSLPQLTENYLPQ